jgi:hypothetical protein
MIANQDRPGHDAARPPPPDAYVHLSLSEINALCLKAARGAGLDWGEAEEAGWAASWLSRAGLAGPSITLAWLNDADHLARPRPAPGLWPAPSGAQCPLRCGTALADFAGLSEGPGAHALTVERVAHPLMVLPFVARAAARTGLDLALGWGPHTVTPWAGVLRHLPDPTDDATVRPADLSIGPADPEQTSDSDRAPPIRGITQTDWRALDALALRITVPASLQSRTGAGAALTDND